MSASLLYDPYVELSGAERAALLDYYKQVARRAGLEVDEDFDEIFYHCALQRLMQALGAYGFLGLQKAVGIFWPTFPRPVVPCAKSRPVSMASMSLSPCWIPSP